VDYYIDRYTSQFDSKQLLKPSSQIIQRLMEHPWPGNVRELQNVLKRFLVVCDWDEIIEELVSNRHGMASTGPAPPATNAIPETESNPFNMKSIISDYLDMNGSDPEDFKDFSLKEIKRKALDHVEREAITFVLDKTGWNRSKASRILKVSYKTLLYKIADLKIKPPSA
jgi:two-component system response regulator AtoC